MGCQWNACDDANVWFAWTSTRLIHCFSISYFLIFKFNNEIGDVLRSFFLSLMTFRCSKIVFCLLKKNRLSSRRCFVSFLFLETQMDVNHSWSCKQKLICFFSIYFVIRWWCIVLDKWENPFYFWMLFLICLLMVF